MLLFETLSQPLTFLIIFGIGFLCGFLFDFENYFLFLVNKNKIIEIILDVFLTIGTCLILYLSIVKFNFGELRVFLIVAFCLGLFVQRISLGRLIAKVVEKCYIGFRKLVSKITYGKFKKKKEKNINN